MEGLTTASNISFILVFLEGIFSFFSPCVIPLIPVYIMYLSGNTLEITGEGIKVYKRKKVLFHTFCFILGISFAFFILGMSFTAIGKFFSSHKIWFTKIGGIIIIILGLFQVGFFNSKFLNREIKFNLNIENKTVNPIIAFVMGFTFSFAWTPCIGPMLSSVLIMASGAKSVFLGNVLVLTYTLGFVIPFLILGMFTAQVLNFIKSKRNIINYTIKAGGIILILIGIMTFTGWINGISGYLNSISPNVTSNTENKNNQNPSEVPEENEKNEESKDNKEEATPAFDFTLKDQYGNEHTLSDYKGKVVFLNFWATWCGYCKEEMPYIEDLYNEYNLNKDDVVFLGIANPKNDEHPYNQDIEKEKIIEFLENNNYTFPTVFDETGDVIMNYGVNSFPFTFLIDKEGNLYGYVPGAMSKDTMINVINQTLGEN